MKQLIGFMHQIRPLLEMYNSQWMKRHNKRQQKLNNYVYIAIVLFGILIGGWSLWKIIEGIYQYPITAQIKEIQPHPLNMNAEISDDEVQTIKQIEQLYYDMKSRNKYYHSEEERVEMILFNELESSVTISWIDPEGREFFVETLHPKQRRVHLTFPGHEFVVRDYQSSNFLILIEAKRDKLYQFISEDRVQSPTIKSEVYPAEISRISDGVTYINEDTLKLALAKELLQQDDMKAMIRTHKLRDSVVSKLDPFRRAKTIDITRRIGNAVGLVTWRSERISTVEDIEIFSFSRTLDLKSFNPNLAQLDAARADDRNFSVDVMHGRNRYITAIVPLAGTDLSICFPKVESDSLYSVTLSAGDVVYVYNSLEDGMVNPASAFYPCSSMGSITVALVRFWAPYYTIS